MSQNIGNITEMKNHTNNLGINSYYWFFNVLENNYISKLNGTQRNMDILKDYDKETQEFIILQLSHVNGEAAADLMSELGIEKISIAKENQKHIEVKMF